MDAFQVNQALAAGDVHRPEVLPKLAVLQDQAVVFQVDFGLEHLPVCYATGSCLRGAPVVG